MRIRFVDFKMHMLVCCSMLVKIMYLYLNFVLLLIRKKLYMIGLSSMIIISVCMIWNLFRANAKLFFFFGLSCYSISNYFCLSIVPFKFSINYICFWPNSFGICSMLITNLTSNESKMITKSSLEKISNFLQISWIFAGLTFEEDFRIHQMIVMKENMLHQVLEHFNKVPR